jgi:hypothetical protein
MRTFAAVTITASLAACSRPLGPPPASPPTMAAAPAAEAAPRAPAAPRVHDGFEFKVRGDFFDGLRGDTAALDRAIKLCEDTLASEPDHVEAMVWHGAAVLGRCTC